MLADRVSAGAIGTTPVDQVAVSERQTDAERTVHDSHRMNVHRLDEDVAHAPDKRRCNHRINTL